jgi:SAM-dependent MidA family methyltransferase
MDDRHGGQPQLVALLRDEIEAAPLRRITFARFMERALTEPRLGYYATSRDRPTRDGDFLTAPELHPFFGRLVGRQLTEVWQRLGEPGTFTVREFGAGRGTLERTVREGLAADRSLLLGGMAWQPVDLGLKAPGRPIASGAIVANEFLDALPVHRAVQRGPDLCERHVTWRDGWFGELEDVPSTDRIASLLADEGVTLADGQAADVSLEVDAWVRAQGSQLERGIVLVIDYGLPASELYGSKHASGTLTTYAGHRAGDDPLRRIGLQDITAHVDLTALDRGARAGGLEPLGATTQARFLAALGLAELLSEMGRDPSTAAQNYLLARSAVARYLDPRQLGGFAVRAFGRGIAAEPPLVGFRDPRGVAPSASAAVSHHPPR